MSGIGQAFLGFAEGQRKREADIATQEDRAIQRTRQKEQDARAAAQEQRAVDTHGVQMQRDKAKLEDEEEERARAQVEQTIKQGLGRFIATDGTDTAALEEAYNAVPDGLRAKIKRNEKGGYRVDLSDGNGFDVKDKDELAMLALSVTDPGIWREMREKDRQFQNQLRIALTNGDKAPAIIQEADRVAKEMPSLPGETASQKWMRAYKMANLRANENPQETRVNLYERVYAAALNNASKIENSRLLKSTGPNGEQVRLTPDEVAQAAAQAAIKAFDEAGIDDRSLAAPQAAPAPGTGAGAAPAAAPAQAGPVDPVMAGQQPPPGLPKGGEFDPEIGAWVFPDPVTGRYKKFQVK